MNTTTTNEPSLLDVDAAVRSVLSELFAASRVIGSRSRQPDEVFAGRLMSLRQAESLPRGLQDVRVAPGTVITPLAREFLKRRGIEIRLVSRSEIERVGNPGEWGFVIETNSGLVDAFRRSLLDETGHWLELGATVDDATLWVSEAQTRGALVLTDEASVAVYRACQFVGVRAATAEDPQAAARAVRSLGVNLLVIEPAGKPISLLKQISSTFRRAGSPVAPSWMERSREGQTSCESPR